MRLFCGDGFSSPPSAMQRPTFADPKTDFAFKRIFGSEEHKDVLVAFLNDILDLDEPHRIVGRQARLPLGLLDRRRGGLLVHEACIHRDRCHLGRPGAERHPLVQLDPLGERRKRVRPPACHLVVKPDRRRTLGEPPSAQRRIREVAVRRAVTIQSWPPKKPWRPVLFYRIQSETRPGRVSLFLLR